MHLENRVLVTGGAGFLGSHLCERLLAQGASVICADNYFTGTRHNIDAIIDHHRFELMPQDHPRQRRPDISKAGEALDWAPQSPVTQNG